MYSKKWTQIWIVPLGFFDVVFAVDESLVLPEDWHHCCAQNLLNEAHKYFLFVPLLFPDLYP